MNRELLDRPLGDISFQDVERLALSSAEEGLRLELKRELPANQGQRDPWMAGSRRIGNPAKDDLAKEVVAFANAYGGLVVVGIEETSDNPRRTNGLSTELIPSVADCADQLQQSLQQIIDPPLPMLEVGGIPRPEGQGEGVLLIRTGPSPRAPHGFRNPPLVYVRRGSRSEPLGMRDIQAMLFETRTRGERLQALRRERVENFKEFNEQLAKGRIIAPGETSALGCGAESLAFRCTMYPTEDLGFSALADHVRLKGVFRPDRNVLSAGAAPAFGEGSFPYRCSPRPRGVRLEEASSRYFARWFVGTDGLIEAAGVNTNGKVYPGWYAVTAAQLVAMVEWLRRLAGRPDVEFVVDGEFLNYGEATASTGGRFVFEREERPVPAGATSFGPISIGPLDRFGEMFSFVEQEIWHALGMFRPEPSKCDFEQYLKP